MIEDLSQNPSFYEGGIDRYTPEDRKIDLHYKKLSL